ncbi:bifunctional demethylmenaquinone methyltransferase/2-methoxy-6-polyprenyl-1,4-benzoquinol methylase UbiE [uncultured Prevotella sp.]|uniref:bifunctional demethylmenaquinone methyltransferase/2-methoxy-6-polyprenyl-1,4-benzoquinol methylase UbiE n=1 Tax=uncultured Prevotella sp. TaxID=159272 RepID=UPI00263897A8|nr:bifunctional demethylmenaquinone methyltransferase/2-methoxy-6-polyprenyl-1,4-benzoquinol methylase UbiE [uncultured Prevotella sp.]
MTYRQEHITPYNNGQEKSKQVETMFDTIAHSYDLLNHRLSLGIDYIWRNTAIKHLKPHKPAIILDVATGTGDFAIKAAKELTPEKVIGIDISEGMMRIGQCKVKKEGFSGIISFEKGDCENLSYNDNTFDAIITAFGIRNFQNLDKSLKEMCRVLKKGGRVCILELSQPVTFPMKQLFWLYSHSILPIYGKLVSKDKNAYRYLTTTIEAFPQGEVMVGILKKAGFTEATFKRLTFGICTCYFATK